MERSRSVATQENAQDQQQHYVRTVMAVMDRLAPPEGRSFAVRLWDGVVLPPITGSPAPFTMVLTHPGALRRMFLPPGELTLAEAFLRGDFEIERRAWWCLARPTGWLLPGWC
jgi:hypothetical protein